MPPKHISSDIMVSFEGREIGSFQSISTDITISKQQEEIELKDRESLSFYNGSYSGTLKDVTVNEEFVGKMLPINQTFTIVGTGYKFPRGKRLPKKKRLRKKWKKKYTREIKLENCVFE